MCASLFKFTACTALFLWSASVYALTNLPVVVTSGGGWSSNAQYRLFVCIAQCTPVGLSSSTAFHGRQGFLQAFLHKASDDLDRDGIADEDDHDDDQDGIADGVELAGSDFTPVSKTDPMNSDSDGDGVPDGAEASAGTNPIDGESFLKVIEIGVSDGHHTLKWAARGGVKYEVLFGATIEDLVDSPTIVTSMISTDGLAPWFSTTAVATNKNEAEAGFYGVRVDD